jgi:hypothetical protein
MGLYRYIAWHAAAVAAGCVVALVLAGWAWWALRRRKLTSEELERRRRLLVAQDGRTIEGEITEIEDARIHYVYTVRGMEYVATQDVSALQEQLPEEQFRVIGTASVKYLRENPANSIVICEEWSGVTLVPAPEQSQS